MASRPVARLSKGDRGGGGSYLGKRELFGTIFPTNKQIIILIYVFFPKWTSSGGGHSRYKQDLEDLLLY